MSGTTSRSKATECKAFRRVTCIASRADSRRRARRMPHSSMSESARPRCLKLVEQSY
jgi:hypothetical protein